MANKKTAEYPRIKSGYSALRLLPLPILLARRLRTAYISPRGTLALADCDWPAGAA